jgi:hypothetical protein
MQEEENGIGSKRLTDKDIRVRAAPKYEYKTKNNFIRRLVLRPPVVQ